eukprot:2477909-Prorocentrum_lima.AAC.1
MWLQIVARKRSPSGRACLRRARIRMKMWLLKGARLEMGDCRGRLKHMHFFGDPVVYDVSAMGTEADLDAQAHALLGRSSS